MTSRRQFVGATLAATSAMAGLPSCSSESSADSYEAVADRTWRHGNVAAGDKTALLHELVRYATLAPSSHNTQCWKFRLEDSAISVLPDLSRRCPAVDPDDHHLFVSLGCAAENLSQAALANGLMGHAGFDAAGGNALRVALEPTRAVASTLFQAIPERQSTRGEYDGQPLARHELGLLERAGTGEGVQVIVLDRTQGDGGSPRVCRCRQHGPDERSRLRGRIEAMDTLQRQGGRSNGRWALCCVIRESACADMAGQPALQCVLHPAERERQVRETRAQFGRHRDIRRGLPNSGPMGGSGTLLRALRAPVGGIGHSQRYVESTGGGANAAAAVWRISGHRKAQTGSCRPVRAGSEAAAFAAASDQCNVGLKSPRRR